VRFVLASVAALIILAVGTTIVGGRVARGQALREARHHASLLAQQVAAPLVDAEVRRRQPTATGRLEVAMRQRMADGSLRHIKLWSADGTVLWSDEGALTGRTYLMPAEVRSLFGTLDATAEVSRLDRAENIGERDESKLLEVYAGAHDADGKPLVFEAYLPLDDLRHDETSIITGVLAVGLGGLVLFQGAVLPMAVSLARRVEHGQRERGNIMRHALEASELERRRIAEQLHDGVIQDMAGISFALPTVETQLADDPAGREAKETLRTITDLVLHDANALRSMLIDLYPPDLAANGLAAALDDVASAARDEGLRVRVEMEADLKLPVETATVAYRMVREGLRNVVKHAAATSATVRIHAAGEMVEVSVADDGVGPAVTGSAGGMTDRLSDTAQGHFGLQLLKDTVRDLGGDVTLTPSVGGGAVLRATMPIDLLGA
jgi:signal transduction histidine kinase